MDLLTVMLVIRAVAVAISRSAAAAAVCLCVCVMESHSQALKIINALIIERLDFSIHGIVTRPPGSQTLSPHTLHFLSLNCKSWSLGEKRCRAEQQMWRRSLHVPSSYRYIHRHSPAVSS